MGDSAAARAKHEAAVDRWRTRLYQWHRDYLMGELTREGLLSTMDEGLLTQAAQIYALATEAFRLGHGTAHVAQTQRYMQIADRMGLHESARAKFPRGEKEIDEIEAALCG